jgi:hypothetical protein
MKARCLFLKDVRWRQYSVTGIAVQYKLTAKDVYGVQTGLPSYFGVLTAETQH